MTVVSDAPEIAEDPIVRALDEFPDLLRQAEPEPEPRYSAEDLALIEERLARFDELVTEAYREVEELPYPSKWRKIQRRELLRARAQNCDTIRFCTRCGLPAAMEMERLDFMERQILMIFPDATPRTTKN